MAHLGTRGYVPADTQDFVHRIAAETAAAPSDTFAARQNAVAFPILTPKRR